MASFLSCPRYPALHLVAGLLWFASPIAARAQSANGVANGSGAAAKDSADIAADTDWTELSDAIALVPKQDGTPGGAKKKAALARADKAQTFYAAHPMDKRATRARMFEIFALLDADDGDRTSQPGKALGQRIQDLVQGFRTDRTVSTADRAVIAGFSDFFRASISSSKPDVVLAAMIDAAHGLIREFPDQPQGYTSLLTFARESEAAGARTLANELVQGTAPLDVQAGARHLIARLSLAGHLVTDYIALTPAERTAADGGKPIVVYVWRSDVLPSVAIANWLSTRAADRAVWIGLNLDPAQQRGAAEQVARDGHYLGRQVYDGGGFDGPIAQAMGIDDLPLLLLASANGTIQDVQAMNQFAAKLAQLGL